MGSIRPVRRAIWFEQCRCHRRRCPSQSRAEIQRHGGGVGGAASPVPAGLTDVVARAAGGGHDLAIKADGTVAAWGNDQHGESTVPVGLNGVIAIAAGARHSLALKSNGTCCRRGATITGRQQYQPV